MKTYTQEELEQQRKVVRRVLETETKEEIEKLKSALKDPELHGEIRNMILAEMAVCETGAKIHNEILATTRYELRDRGNSATQARDNPEREIDARREIGKITHSTK